MIYGLFQYYGDELSSWNRIVKFHKEESDKLIRQITVVVRQQVISTAHENEGESFIDQFMVQHQEFDHITNQIISQQQRLERIGSFPGQVIEYSVCSKQDSLRSKMQSIERNFTRTKYTCSIFLSSFLNDQLSTPLKSGALN